MPIIINGEQIGEDLIGQEFSEIKAFHERVGQISCCERDDEFRATAIDNITGRVLVAQEARRHDAPVSKEEIDEAIEKLKEEHGGDQQFYYNMGLTPEQDDVIRENVSASLSVDKLLREICGDDPIPGDDELKAFYEERIDDYKSAEEVRASHIFKSVQQAEERENLFKELCEIRQSLLDGADFTKTAEKHSDKPAEEIDLGFFKRGELMEEFEIMTFSMNVGEISPVFTMHGSFHIATVTDRKPAVPRPFDEIRDELTQAWLQVDRDRKIKAYIEELKSKAAIETIEVDEDESGEAIPPAATRGGTEFKPLHASDRALPTPDHRTRR